MARTARGAAPSRRQQIVKKVAKSKAKAAPVKKKLTVAKGSKESSVLTTALNAALDDITQTLLRDHHKILLTQRYVHTEKLFKVVDAADKFTLHKTLIYLSQAPKALMRAVLIKYSEYKNAKVTWTDELLNRADRVHHLKGVQNLFFNLADLDADNKIHVHHRKAFVEAYFRRMKLVNRPLPQISGRDGKISFESCQCYKYQTVVDGKFTEIYHFAGTKITIPDDYNILDNNTWTFSENHSSLLAEIQGRRRTGNVWDLFEEVLGDDWDHGADRDEKMADIVVAVKAELGDDVKAEDDDEDFEQEELPPPAPVGDGRPKPKKQRTA